MNGFGAVIEIVLWGIVLVVLYYILNFLIFLWLEDDGEYLFFDDDVDDSKGDI